MGLDGDALAVTSWAWRAHTSRASGKEMLAVTYYGALSDTPVTEYLTVLHDGYAGDKALRLLATIAGKAGVQLEPGAGLDDTANALNNGQCPSELEYRRDGKFYRVLKRTWA
jgi:DNA repair protein RadD